MKVLITAPNLDERINVSGISTVTRQIIERGSNDYFHFEAGRRDGEPADARWILRQMNSVRLFWSELKNKQIDLVHLNTNYNPLSVYRDAAYAATAHAAGIPILLHLHGGRFLAEEFKNPVLSRIAEKTARSAAKVLVLSELEKETIEKRWRGLKPQILENAVAIEEAVKAERKHDIPVLIFLGRFHESKGLREIIAVCRVLKNENFEFHFHAYGAGALEDFFVGEMTAVLGENFHFGGVVSGKEKWQSLADADIFVLPSRYGEGLPVAMLEAMASGCIVIVSEMASTGAVIENGANGFLVQPGNAAQLIERLKYLLENKSVWEKLRQTARRTIEERFSLDVYIKRLENIYRETVNSYQSSVHKTVD